MWAGCRSANYGLRIEAREYCGYFYANTQRVKESLRVLEEFAKLDSPVSAERFKTLRYKVYGLEKKLLNGCKLYLILDAGVCSYDRLFEVLKAAAFSGVDIVQLRDKVGFIKIR